MKYNLIENQKLFAFVGFIDFRLNKILLKQENLSFYSVFNNHLEY